VKERPKGWKKTSRGEYDDQALAWIKETLDQDVTFDQFADLITIFFWWRDEDFNGGEEGRKQRAMSHEIRSEIYEYLLLANGEWEREEQYGSLVPKTERANKLREMAEYLHYEHEPLNLF
jgi:hypothetical protein